MKEKKLYGVIAQKVDQIKKGMFRRSDPNGYLYLATGIEEAKQKFIDDYSHPSNMEIYDVTEVETDICFITYNVPKGFPDLNEHECGDYYELFEVIEINNSGDFIIRVRDLLHIGTVDFPSFLCRIEHRNIFDSSCIVSLELDLISGKPTWKYYRGGYFDIDYDPIYLTEEYEYDKSGKDNYMYPRDEECGDFDDEDDDFDDVAF